MANVSEPVPVALRVFRCKEGESHFLRLLQGPHDDGRIKGLLCHWCKKRSHYCLGNDCPPAIHRSGSQWRGYLAAEHFQERLGVWHPVCFEVTEYSELEMRDLAQRGQTWTVSRAMRAQDKIFPVVARLHARNDPSTMPAPFPLLPTLQHIYHCPWVALNVDCPLPSRTFVSPSIGDDPRKASEQPTKDSPEEEAKRRELLTQLKKRLNGSLGAVNLG